MNAAPLKVRAPTIAPGMEQWCDAAGLRIKSGQIWPFVQIAVNASQSQILRIIRSTVCFGNDVLYVECRQRGIILAKMTILAAVSRSFSNAGSRPLVHPRSGFRFHQLPRLTLNNSDKFICPDVPDILPFLGGSQLSLRRFAGQLFDTRFEFC